MDCLSLLVHTRTLLGDSCRCTLLSMHTFRRHKRVYRPCSVGHKPRDLRSPHCTDTVQSRTKSTDYPGYLLDRYSWHGVPGRDIQLLGHTASHRTCTGSNTFRCSTPCHTGSRCRADIPACNTGPLGLRPSLAGTCTVDGALACGTRHYRRTGFRRHMGPGTSG